MQNQNVVDILERTKQKLAKEIQEIESYITTEILRTSDTFIVQVIDKRAERDALFHMLNLVKKLDASTLDVEDLEKIIKNKIEYWTGVSLNNDATYIRFNIQTARKFEMFARWFIIDLKDALKEAE